MCVRVEVVRCHRHSSRSSRSDLILYSAYTECTWSGLCRLHRPRVAEVPEVEAVAELATVAEGVGAGAGVAQAVAGAVAEEEAVEVEAVVEEEAAVEKNTCPAM